MGIQQGVNAISAGVLGAAVAGKHLKQQAEAVKSSELKELAGLDRAIADKQEAADAATEAYTDALVENNTFSEKAKEQQAVLEKKMSDKRLSPYGMAYGSYLTASQQIDEDLKQRANALKAAEMRSMSADEDLKLYKDRKAELEAKYGKYKW